jgi:2-iminobutanoate/2-iminopropanoate deaminase
VVARTESGYSLITGGTVLNAVRHWTPPELAPPIGKYSHLSQAAAGHSLVFVAGQVGNRPGGGPLGDAADQARQIYANLAALVDHLGVTPANIVKLFTLVAGVEHLPAFYAARDEIFREWYPDGVYPTHSLAVVAALAAPEVALEVEAVVAVPDGATP